VRALGDIAGREEHNPRADRTVRGRVQDRAGRGIAGDVLGLSGVNVREDLLEEVNVFVDGRFWS
jgi:hypothetical protein